MPVSGYRDDRDEPIGDRAQCPSEMLTRNMDVLWGAESAGDFNKMREREKTTRLSLEDGQSDCGNAVWCLEMIVPSLQRQQTSSITGAKAGNLQVVGDVGRARTVRAVRPSPIATEWLARLPNKYPPIDWIHDTRSGRCRCGIVRSFLVVCLHTLTLTPLMINLSEEVIILSQHKLKLTSFVSGGASG